MSFKVKNKHVLKRKEIKNIFDEIRNNFSIEDIDNLSKVEAGLIDGVKMVFIDDVPCLMYIGGELFFTIHGLLRFRPNDRFVVVDMGAVKFVTSGADVMAPGIIDADENIMKDDQVWICDEQHRKPLAVGLSLMSGLEMVKQKKGKSVKIIHYVGDKFWNLVK